MFELYRPSSSSDPTAPYVVYPTSLFTLKLGYALWYPEPHETGEPQIGDVGYVREGAFIRLFNINTSRPEHQVPFWGNDAFTVTESLDDRAFRLDKRPSAIHHGHYPSHGVRKKEVGGSLSLGFSEAVAAVSAGYTCKEAQGALLVLQSQGHSENVFESRRLKAYMLRQHEHWCAHVNDVLEHEISPGEIVLVGGWVKTSADWAAMAFSNILRKHHAALTGKAGGLIGVEFFGSRTRVQSGPKVHRKGSRYPRRGGVPETELERDQSMFLRRYKVKRRFGFVKSIVAGAGYDRLPEERGEEGQPEGVIVGDGRLTDECDDGLRWQSQDKVIDPLDALLDYILEVSEAEVAVAYDQDLDSMVGFESWPMDVATYIRKTQPPVDVEGVYGSISISELLSHEQLQKLENRFISAADLHEWPHITERHAAKAAVAAVRFTDEEDPWSDLPDKWRYLRFDTTPGTVGAATSVFAVSPDGTLLAGVSGGGRNIVVWRLSDGLTVQTLRHPGTTGVFTCLGFAPDSRTLVVGSTDSTATVWSVQRGEEVLQLVGHGHRLAQVSYSPDGAHIVTASVVASVLFWDAKTGFPLCHYPLHHEIQDLVFSLDGSHLVIRTRTTVTLFSTPAGGPIVRRADLKFSETYPDVHDVVLSPDGSRMAVLIMEDINQRAGSVYDTKDLAVCCALEDSGDLLRAAFAPDGRELETVSLSGAVDAWNATDGKMLASYGSESSWTAIAVSPDGRFVAAAGEKQGDVRVWSRGAADLVVNFTSLDRDFKEVMFLPDSRRLLTVSKTGAASLWNVGDALRVR